MNQYNVGDTCPICSQGKLEREIINAPFDYKGQRLIVPDYPVFRCNSCGEEYVDEKTINNAEKKIRDFQRKVDNLLTSVEIISIRKKLRLTQAALAEKLGVSRPTIARYESGQQAQSKSQDLHLRLLIQNPTCLRFLESSQSQWSTKLAGGTILYNPTVDMRYQLTITTNRVPSDSEDYNDGNNPIALAA